MGSLRRSDPLLLAVALCAAAGWAIACTPPQERAQRDRQTIQQEIARGNRAAALRAVDDLRETLPDTADSLLEVSQLMVQAGDAPRASWLLEAGLRRFPRRDDVRLAVARVSLLLGNPSHAREVVLPIAPGSKQDAAALVVRAQAELGLGNLHQALATLEEAEKRYPQQPDVWLVHISTLLSEQHVKEARAAVEEARAALAGNDPKTVEVRHRLDVTLAQIQAQQGDADAALTTLRGMVASDPADLLAWRALVQALAQQKRAQEALPLLSAALSSPKAPLELYLVEAQVQTALGDDSLAEAALRSFAARSDSPAAVLPLVELYSKRNDPEAARGALDQSLARHPEEPSLHLLRTEALLGEGKVDEARAEAARFQETTFAGDPQIEYLQARLDLAEGDTDAAVGRLRALAPKLDRAATHYWLGRALEESGDLEGARRRYALAQRKDPTWAAPMAALIALDQRLGDWREVAASAEALVQSAPRELGGWVALVDARDQLGEGKSAEAVARRCIARFPHRAEPHVLLAKALRTQGRTDEALAALDQARQIEASPELTAERAMTLGLGGRPDEGIRVARTALEETPDSAPLQAALAALLFAKGAADEGAAATDRAFALAPDDPQPLRVRCEFRASVSDWSGAREDCTRYLAARPDDPGARFMMGVVLGSIGDTAGAKAAYRRAAALDERDPRPRNNLAELLAQEGDLDGALAAAQDAYRLDEKSPYVKDTLGTLYWRKGLDERAVALLEEAHAALPHVPEVTLHLALACRDAGRIDRARRLLTDVKQDQQASVPTRGQADSALRSLP